MFTVRIVYAFDFRKEIVKRFESKSGSRKSSTATIRVDTITVFSYVQYTQNIGNVECVFFFLIQRPVILTTLIGSRSFPVISRYFPF